MGLEYHGEGLEARFPHDRGAQGMGRARGRFREPGLGDGGLARGDSAISKAFSQNWKWSHLIASACTQDQKERFLKPFLANHRYVMGRGITEPNAEFLTTGCRPMTIPRPATGCGPSARATSGVNGEKCFIANGSVGSLFFVDARSNLEVNIKQGGTLFHGAQGHAGLSHRQGVQQAWLAFLPECGLIFENARVPHANVVGEVGAGSVKSGKGDTTGGDMFGDLELAANALGVCDDAVEMAMKHARAHKRAGKCAWSIS